MGSSQNGFIKGKSCFISLIAFYDEMTGLVDEGRAVEAVYLVFSNAFDTQTTLGDKLMMYGLDKWTGSTSSPRPVISGAKSIWSSSLVRYTSG